MGVVGRYLRDPDANRAELLRMTHDLDRVPTPFLLSVADAHVRDGRLDAASAVLAELVSRGTDRPWAAWAELGLGWIALARGDHDTARTFYDHVAAGPDSAGLARVLLLLLDAVDGRGEDNAAALDAVAGDARVDDTVRTGARLGAAYARYWAKDYAAAETAFGAVAAGGPPLTDDGRYGIAWTRWRRGDRDGALALLHELARGAPDASPSRHVSRGLVELAPSAVFRASLDRYRTIRPGRPEDQLVPILDVDGARLARAALKRLEPDATTVGAEAEAPVHAAADPAPAGSAPGDAAHRPMPVAAAPVASSAPPSPTGVPWLLLVALTALVTAVVVARRRART